MSGQRKPGKAQRDLSYAELFKQRRQLAQDVLIVAFLGGMPGTYWHTDSRIERACDALGWTPTEAREWAEGDS